MIVFHKTETVISIHNLKKPDAYLLKTACFPLNSITITSKYQERNQNDL